MYTMLAGQPPFIGKSQEETKSQISVGKVDYTRKYWFDANLPVAEIFGKLPAEALTLLKKMLTTSPDKRISAKEALTSPWLKKLEAEEDDEKVQPIDARISLRKLKNFNAQIIMQKAVLTYFVTLQMMPQEEKRIREMFAHFDIDRDGHLSLEDLTNGYMKVHGDPARARKDAQTIMKKMDLNRNGTIDFTGALTFSRRE